MRWQELFADLEGQAEAWERAELDAEVADRSRAELATVELTDRLSAAVGGPLDLQVVGAGRLHGRLDQVGSDWLLLQEDGGGEAVVPCSAIALVNDLGRRSAAPSARSTVLSRLGLVSPLRAIARDRAAVRLWLRDGSRLVGTPSRAGADHVDLVVHGIDELARGGTGRHVTVPFVTISLVRAAASPWT